MAKSDYRLDLGKFADVWMHGSVVRSWLLELAVGALKQDPKLEKLKGYVQDSGEGRWMIQDAIDKDVPVPTLTAALFTRFPIAAGGIVRGENVGGLAQRLRRT